jgi:hypothetical protein
VPICPPGVNTTPGKCFVPLCDPPPAKPIPGCVLRSNTPWLEYPPLPPGYTLDCPPGQKPTNDNITGAVSCYNPHDPAQLKEHLAECSHKNDPKWMKHERSSGLFLLTRQNYNGTAALNKVNSLSWAVTLLTLCALCRSDRAPATEPENPDKDAMVVVDAGAPLCPDLNGLYGIQGVGASSYLTQQVATKMGCVFQDRRVEVSPEQMQMLGRDFVSINQEGTVRYTFGKYVHRPSSKETSSGKGAGDQVTSHSSPQPAYDLDWYLAHGWVKLAADSKGKYFYQKPAISRGPGLLAVWIAQVTPAPDRQIAWGEGEDITGRVVSDLYWLDCNEKRVQRRGSRMYKDYKMSRVVAEEIQPESEKGAYQEVSQGSLGMAVLEATCPGVP